MDMILTDESPTDISDKIKEILFAKSAENVNAVRPEVAASLFGDVEDWYVNDFGVGSKELSDFFTAISARKQKSTCSIELDWTEIVNTK